MSWTNKFYRQVAKQRSVVNFGRRALNNNIAIVKTAPKQKKFNASHIFSLYTLFGSAWALTLYENEYSKQAYINNANKIAANILEGLFWPPSLVYRGSSSERSTYYYRHD